MKTVELTLAEAAIFRDMLNFRLHAAATQGEPVPTYHVPYVVHDDEKAHVYCTPFRGGIIGHVLSEIEESGPHEPFNYAPETIATLIAKFPMH